MRKTLAYLLSLLTLFTIGLAILHPSYKILADWLGPLLGSHIYTMFTFIYLILANPFRYTTVAITWIIVGLLIGIISGKKLGASITALFTWLTTLPLLAASIAGIYLNLESIGISNKEVTEIISIIPTIPSQLTFNKLFQIPIFSDIFFQLIETIPRIEETTDPSAILMELASPHLVSIAAKPVLIITSAILGAAISSTLIKTIRNTIPDRKNAMGALIILIITLSLVPFSTCLNLEDGVYTEVIGGYTDERGRAIISQLLVGNQLEIVPMDTDETQGLVASLVLTQKIYDPSILYTLSIENITNYVHLRNLIPNTFAVNLYLGENTDSIQEKSNQVINYIEQDLDLQFKEVIALPLRNDGELNTALPTMTAVFYYSQNNIEEASENLLKDFTENGGFTRFIEETINPESHLDIEVYARGFIHAEPFEGIIPVTDIPQNYTDEYNTLIESRYNFLAGVQITENALDPQGSSYLFDISSTLGVESTPNYSTNSDGSFIITARSNKTGITEPLDPTTHIKTSLPENSMELMILSTLIQELGAVEIETGTPQPLDTQITVPEAKIPEVTTTKTSQRDNDETTVTITVTNNHYDTIKNLKLIDSFPKKYRILTSGTNTVTETTLAPEETLTHSYTIKPTKPGKYTDTPAVLSYELDEETILTYSNTLESIENTPNPITMLADNYRASSSILNMVTNEKGVILTYAIVAFITLVAIIDIYKYMRKRSNDEPEEVKGPPSLKPEGNPEDLQ